MIRIGKTKISIPMILFMYMLIYNPPVLAPLFCRNSVWLVMLPSAAYVLLNWKAFRKFMIVRAVVWTEIILGAIFIYLVLMAKINGNDFSLFVYFVYWMAGDIPFALACWIWFRKNGFGAEELLDHLLAAGLLMAVTAVAALLISPVKEFFTEKMLAYGMSHMVTVKLSVYRDFGLAANLTSTAAYVQAALACIALWRGIRGKYLWLLAFPVLAFSANINLRSSVYLILAGMAAVLAGILFTKDRKLIGIFFAAASAAGAVACFGLGWIRLINPMTHEWLARGLEEVSTFAAGAKSPYADGYFGELAWMLAPEHFPKGVKLIFGAGTEIMGTLVEEKYGVSSDVGFMNDLWRGGILYLAVMTGLYLRMLWKIVNSRTIRRETGVFLALLCLFFFGITNIKGHFFIHSDLTALIWILIAGLVWNRCDSCIRTEKPDL